MMVHDGSRVRIHYVCFDDSTDEWRDFCDIIQLGTVHQVPGQLLKQQYNNNTNTTIHSLYNELRIKIKQALVRGRKQSPLSQ